MNKVLEMRDRVLSFVQSQGPLIPIRVAKHFKSDSLFISALLSELRSGGKILLTKAKIGGTPVYYTAGQEAKLGGILREHLKQFPRKAFDLLKESKVIRDVDCEPAMRAALRDIKDFAIPLNVQIEGNEELFWKWHTITDEDTKMLINAILEKVYKKEEPKSEIKEKPVVEETEPVEEDEDKSEQEKINEEIKEKFSEPEAVEEQEIKEPEEEQEIKESKEKEEEPEEKEEETSFFEEKKEQETLLKNDKPKEKDKDFEKTIVSFLNKKQVMILEKQTITKNREFNFIVKVPSNMGELMYFVKAKNKKKINEGDLLLAFTEGQNLKLPTVYVTNADVTKKAITYMEKNMKGLMYKKINF